MKRPGILATTKVETSKHLVVVVKRAVRQNVRLDAAKEPETLAEALVEPVGCSMLLRAPKYSYPRWRAAFRHRLQGLDPVRVIGVADKDSAQVLRR